MKGAPVCVLLLFIALATDGGTEKVPKVGKNTTVLYPCKGNTFIQYHVPKEQPLNDTEKNFVLFIDKKLQKKSSLTLTLGLVSEHNLQKPSSQYTFISEEVIEGKIYEEKPYFKKLLRTTNGKAPFLSSVKINDEEQCLNPSYVIRDRNECTEKRPTQSIFAPTQLENADCGRTKLSGSGFIHQSLSTKPGDWPWHVALFVAENAISQYKCGGTLISRTMVLTAAHCVTTKGIPILTSSIKVGLGKYNIFFGNTDEQEREVKRIIVHDDYDEMLVANDIALLQLQAEAVFTNFVQPACLWNDKDILRLKDPSRLNGTVVGWGKNEFNELSMTLRRLEIPKISEVDCVRSNPNFFGNRLNDGNFCAGYRNGSSVCNGDSGGGFMVFIPDEGDRSEKPQGSWHVRGITSLGILKEILTCDPKEYTLYTDVSKFTKWISENLENQI